MSGFAVLFRGDVMLMKYEPNSWSGYLARVLVLGCVIFGAVRLAIAGAGVSGGAARTSVTISGVLTGVNGTPMATFHFRHGATEVCAPSVAISGLDPVTHAFSVEVPIDACPSLFDGSDVAVSVDINGTANVVSAATVNPVPYAHYASQVGTPDCPVGYQVDSANLARERRICRKRLRDGVYDEVVGVGWENSTFWIDRYEASVWGESTAMNRVNAGSAGNFGVLPPNGQFVRGDGRNAAPLNAWSVAGQIPTGTVTWFQARELCRMSGKRLPTNEEWDAAARGTPDPGELGDGRERRCLTNAAIGRTGEREPAEGFIGCQSVWGAQDMIGNVWEWTADWMSPGDAPNLGSDAGVPPGAPAGWPAIDAFRGDLSTNVPGVVFAAGEFRRSLPAAVLRGGAANNRTTAGVFTFNLNHPPYYAQSDMGFRCVIPR